MTVLHILKDRLRIKKIASRWVPEDLTNCSDEYDTTPLKLTGTLRSVGYAFLRRIIVFDETWARSYEPQLKRQSNEWRHYGSPRKTKVPHTAINTKVMVILVYVCDGVILVHTV